MARFFVFLVCFFHGVFRDVLGSKVRVEFLTLDSVDDSKCPVGDSSIPTQVVLFNPGVNE